MVKLGDILYFLPFSHPETGGTNLEEGGRVHMGDPDNVFTAMLESIVLNPTYIGSRKKEL